MEAKEETKSFVLRAALPSMGSSLSPTMQLRASRVNITKLFRLLMDFK